MQFFAGKQRTFVQKECYLLECEEPHQLFKCPTFLDMNVERKELVLRKLRLCRFCFQRNHTEKHCKKGRFLCKKDEHCLKDKHHFLLHKETASNMAQTQNTQVTLPYVKAVVVNPTNGLSKTAIFIIDSGSDQTVLSQTIKEDLQLSGKKLRIPISTPTGISSNPVLASRIQITTSDRQHSTTVVAKVIPGFMPGVTAVDWNKHTHKWKHLQNLQFPSLRSDYGYKIQGLLGNDVLHLTAPTEVRRPLKGGQPMAEKTLFGWTAKGPLEPDNNCGVTSSNHMFARQEVHDLVEHELQSTYDADLVRMIERSWDVPILQYGDHTLTFKERQFVEQMKERYTRANNRAQMPILWKGWNAPWEFRTTKPWLCPDCCHSSHSSRTNHTF